MRKHLLKIGVTVAATTLGAGIAVAQPASAAQTTQTAQSVQVVAKKAKLSDVRACNRWKPTAKGLVNVVVDIVVEDKNPTRALRKKVLRYADKTREASAAAKTRDLRISLRHTAEAAEAWVDGNLDFYAAEDLLDEMVTPMDRCLDLT